MLGFFSLPLLPIISFEGGLTNQSHSLKEVAASVPEWKYFTVVGSQHPVSEIFLAYQQRGNTAPQEAEINP